MAIRNRSSFNIALLPKDMGLDAVVVVGYGTQKRRDVTGAIGFGEGEAIKNMPVTDVAAALQGRVAGVEVVKSSGEPGAPTQITIRVWHLSVSHNRFTSWMVFGRMETISIWRMLPVSMY